ncbi:MULTISPECIES: DUF2911 domain-containing protein [unclassified Mucilaginibacter]|uniref:DUF2911 domain-containing protein n=1 Tax=unclassified Mucilaginibacter TaxID=2617802 RepID=UPI00095B29DC|nr:MULTISPECIES: DUF2911 domain-containing protein [unclassified Mucilaginibacter]OJW15397.1 MAG: hypothetical protein BGO48_14120 [Mucilaginibacter sp. 44-25]PLW88400.1 MAG: hypothetical protein C0154_16905 [Mucilaginibacter sp.]HEK21722.1 DUF2911 domain-containing protein [Bacteroidota bacterium]
MKSKNLFRAATLCVVAMLFSAFAFAQDKPVPSPRDSVSAKVNGATITINYGSPAVKGRSIYGGLVPYGQVWRAGANEATVFTTDKDIMVEGKKLPAGTYGLFTIPTATTWTIIFNKVAKQWGAYKYDEAQDALRVMVKPVKAPMSERLVYKIYGKGFSLNWDKLSVPVRIK